MERSPPDMALICAPSTSGINSQTCYLYQQDLH
jgi:hypothetical protein